MSDTIIETDVAIIGGGPGGSTLASLIKKYAPERKVLILEKEKFPRDHVGESQLPAISGILHEMGCWDEVEAADFPLKVGATYRWGKSSELWDFDFAAPSEVEKLARPTAYEGLRHFTAFQVDRARYDDILLRHAESLGTEVMEETMIAKVHRDGDRVEGLETRDGTMIKAKLYIDASGHIGVLRRGMGVETKPETNLQNIAMWDYWDNADWAVEIGVGGTRVQVMSQAAGWMWFIPLGPTRTSIGYVCPVDYYKAQDKSPEELYKEAIKNDDRISSLIKNATPRGLTETTSDWSFTSDRVYGENWFLVGESAGFADPILAAGLTLTHTGARELAYVINDLFEDPEDADWLRESYQELQLRRIRQHIRFADFWYAANGQFTDLKDHCAQIAKESGIRMTPEAAWRWLAQGGFTNEGINKPGIGTCDMPSLKQVLWVMTDKKGDWALNKMNVLKLNTHNAERKIIPSFVKGKIERQECFARGQNQLPLVGHFKLLVDILSEKPEITIGEVYTSIENHYAGGGTGHQSPLKLAIQSLEAMINEGWVTGYFDKKKPKLDLVRPEENDYVHWNRDGEVGKSA